jgi:hypothetical protein
MAKPPQNGTAAEILLIAGHGVGLTEKKIFNSNACGTPDASLETSSGTQVPAPPQF